MTVGTSDFYSPKLVGRWRERDDWLGLALLFLSLRMPFPFANKRAALEQALALDWLPHAREERITKCFKVKCYAVAKSDFIRQRICTTRAR